MIKPRTDYKYIAYRLDTSDNQNLGDFGIRVHGEHHRFYHFASPDYPERPGAARRRGRLVNRGALVHIGRGSRIYDECMRAIERLKQEEAVGVK